MEILNWKTGKVLFVLNGRSLLGADLRGASLPWANLEYMNLAGTDLRGANLKRSRLSRAVLRSANLEGADLRGADMTGADLADTNLESSNMSRVILSGATLRRTKLKGTKLYRTSLGYASFSFCDTLYQALRLETVRHHGPSSIDQHTLRHGFAEYPDVFLEGIGYSKNEIRGLKDMYIRHSQPYLSCFLSHAKADAAFVERLYTHLTANNVACWQFVHDMRGGKEWEGQIKDAIRDHDKLVLIYSQRALYRPNVVKEIVSAIEDERATGIQKLFPIRLDDHILTEAMMDEAREKVRSGEWGENWVYYITKYHIPDFSRWESESFYEPEFEKLLEALEKPAKRV